MAEGGVVIHVREYETRARTRTSATRNRMARFGSMGSSLLGSRNHLSAGNYCNRAPIVTSTVRPQVTCCPLKGL